MAKRAAPSGLTTSKSRNVGAEQKAIWHNTLGAGRNQIVREFLGLTLADEAWVLAVAFELIEKRVGDQFR
jgi:hypothetical protein